MRRQRTRPKVTALAVDLCDHWLIVPNHRCQNYWREEIELTEPTQVDGSVMAGHYEIGTWHFCRTHARIFRRDRRDNGSTT